MTTQPGANLYTQGFGSHPENVEIPVVANTAPPSTNVGNYPIGKRWIDKAANAEYVLTSSATSNGVVTPTWTLLGTNSGALNTLSDGSTVVTPTAGNIEILGTAGQIASTGSNGPGAITLSLIGPYTPATYTAHGVLIGEGASSIVSTAAGTNGQVLIGSTGADPAFSTITSTGGTITVTGGAHTLNLDIVAPLTVPNGGTGATTLTGVLTGNGAAAITANTVTQHGVLIGGASNAVSSLAVAATGTLLAGSTGADPAFTGSPSVSGSLTAATTITATLGAITATNGNLVLGTAGNKLAITTGANASIGTSVAMTAGSVTVATTAVTASSTIFLTANTPGGTQGVLSAPTASIVAATSFVINSSSALDTSTVNWWIVN